MGPQAHRKYLQKMRSRYAASVERGKRVALLDEVTRVLLRPGVLKRRPTPDVRLSANSEYNEPYLTRIQPLAFHERRKETP
jgi:hypothetical protein